MENQQFKLIKDKDIFVSEPNPSWFGNDQNEKNNANWTNQNWLKSRFHFAFAEYTHGPQQFGTLRVLNDDLVQPNRGFGTHPHANMEICTYIVDGSLTHKDSMGTSETLGRGSICRLYLIIILCLLIYSFIWLKIFYYDIYIQFMTAGTGVRHSEHNLDKEKPLRFIQIWIVPRKQNLKPNYGSFQGSKESEEARKNKWAYLVSDVNENRATPVKINQDTIIAVSEFDQNIEYELKPGRQAYFLCIEGQAKLQENQQSYIVQQHDGARIIGPNTLKFTPDPSAHVMILEMNKN